MQIPDAVIAQAARIAWADEPGATVAEFDTLSITARNELMDTARKAAQVVVWWTRSEALKEASNRAAEVARAKGTAWQVADAVHAMRVA